MGVRRPERKEPRRRPGLLEDGATRPGRSLVAAARGRPLPGPLSRALDSYLALRGERIGALEMRLASLNPAGVLARGYAVVHRQDTHEPVTSVEQVSAGDDLSITVAGGDFPARVTQP